MNEMFGRNLFLSDKIVEPSFCDCEDECIRDRWIPVSISFVLHFEYVASVLCRHTFRFEKIAILCKDSIDSE